MAGVFSHVASVTIPQFLRQEIDATTRNYKMLAMLQAKGKMSFNNGGTRCEWPVKFKQNIMQSYADRSGALSFPAVNRHKRAVTDWGAYLMKESISRMDLLQNQGEPALVKLYADKAQDCIKEMREQFHTQLYIDGNASGNEDCIDGFETYMGISGAAAGGFIGSPNSTYAGLSCVLGNEGGTWSTQGGNVDWPRGFGDVEYDYWSPIVALYDGTGWSIPTATWAARAEEVIRFCITHAARNQSMEGMIDGVFLNSEMWRVYKDLVAGKERITVTKGEAISMTSLGFTDVMNQDGAEITSEFGIPVNTGYGLNFDEMELQSMNADLFNFIGPDWYTTNDAYLMMCAFNGQLRTMTPRNQFKIRATP